MPSIPLGTQGILSVPFRASLKLDGQFNYVISPFVAGVRLDGRFNYVISLSVAGVKLPSRFANQLVPGLQIIAAEKRYSPNSISQTANTLILSKLGYQGFTPASTNTLESFIAAFIAYLASTIGNAGESKINCDLIAVYVDDSILGYVFEVKFRKPLAIVDDEITNLPTSFNPMDF